MKIICLHQGSELYGSDRSFLQVVKYLKQSQKFETVTVVLQEGGPLVTELKKIGAEIRFTSLSILRKTFLKKLQWGKIIFPLFSLRKKYKFLKEYDIVYVNTSVIMDAYLLAPFINKKKILHIREIPAFPLNKLFSFLISRGDFTVLFNSHSTKRSFKIFKNSHVIHNAFEGFIAAPEDIVKKHPATTPNELRLLLIGRINNWKGQDFAIEALSYLKADERIILKIVGNIFKGNEELLIRLKDKVKRLGLEDKVEFVDFVADPYQEYLWADVIIVPSTRPEPFGRIAIEGMSVNKPVIAANHGGLPEIISHSSNGFLFTPENIPEFLAHIRTYYYDNELLKIHGQNSFKIFKEKFSIEKMYKNLDIVF